MQNCERCYFKKWLKTGKTNEDGIPYWKCGRCGKEQLGDYPFERVQPKILYYDVEVSLSDLYGNFGLTVRGERMSHKMLKKPYFIICWSAMWVGSNRIHSACVTQKEALARTDKNILAPLWDLINKADIVAGHNLDKYDAKVVNTRFIANGFTEPMPPQRSMDTLTMARKRWKMESNTLDYICKFFGIPQKDKMSIDDWIEIQETGNPKTLAKMLKYNRGDVRNGVKVLEILKGWHPFPANFGMAVMPREPLDTRKERQTPLREIQDSLDEIVQVVTQ